MAKLLSERQVVARQRKVYREYVEKHNVNEDSIEFYTDLDGDLENTVRMYVPETNKSVAITCDKLDGEVTLKEFHGQVF